MLPPAPGQFAFRDDVPLVRRRANSLEKTLMLAKEKGLAQDEMVR